MPVPRDSTDANRWLERAQSSLRLAAARTEGVLLEDLAYGIQQSIEKALKGVILGFGLEYPLTHDIERLRRVIVDAGMDVPFSPPELASITPYAFVGRYPMDIDPIGEGELEAALLLAERVLAWAMVMVESI